MTYLLGGERILDAASFADRIAVANGPLRPLADSLAAELEPLLHREIYFPREKALLSRTTTGVVPVIATVG